MQLLRLAEGSGPGIRPNPDVLTIPIDRGFTQGMIEFGQFSITGNQTGSYSLTFSSPGFQDFVLENGEVCLQLRRLVQTGSRPFCAN